MKRFAMMTMMGMSMPMCVNIGFGVLSVMG